MRTIRGSARIALFHDAELKIFAEAACSRQMHEAEREIGAGHARNYALALYPDSRRIR